MTSTMMPPTVPSGLRRSICSQTSTYQGNVRGSPWTSRAMDGAGTGATEAMVLPVPYPGVQVGVGKVDDEIQPDHHRGHDQVDRLHDGIVQAGERLEEEQAHPGQAEDCLDNDRAADVERHLQADQAHDRDQRVLERVAQHDSAL